jgi:protein-disulfide isomerase
LAAFNKTMQTDIKEADIKSKSIIDIYNHDLELADDMMVQGTPTLIFDGKLDKTKKKYKKAN